MDDNVIIRTAVPLLLLIGAGFISRKMRILKSGDERVFNAYVYYFALPALFFVNIVETKFTGETLIFIFAGILPVLLILTIFVFLRQVFKFSRNTLYLLILSTVFGSLAFFGIPFVMFVFPTVEGEHLAALSSASISMVSVTISITVLELYKLKEPSIREGLRLMIGRLSRNPLIISISSGILLSILGIEIPSPISTSLHMLGGTTSTVAIFMLGVFLYGRKYTNISQALGLSLLRIVLMPTVALFATLIFNLPHLQRTTLVLMHGMPVAISMIVLSQRYSFYEETVASMILVSSLGASAYLNLWLFLLNML
jgi:predicted permease